MDFFLLTCHSIIQSNRDRHARSTFSMIDPGPSSVHWHPHMAKKIYHFLHPPRGRADAKPRQKLQRPLRSSDLSRNRETDNPASNPPDVIRSRGCHQLQKSVKHPPTQRQIPQAISTRARSAPSTSLSPFRSALVSPVEFHATSTNARSEPSTFRSKFRSAGQAG